MGVWCKMSSTSREMMVIQAAREIKGEDVVLVGVGLPNIAANLSKKLYSPNITLIYESGSIDCFPRRQPLSIGDPSLSENVSALFSLFDTFSYLIVGGRINVAYLGAAQVDLNGRLNTTVIGNYESPKVRLPGSGGACEILSNAMKSVILVEFSEERIRRKVDFVTSSMRTEDVVSHGKILQEEVIITDKCIIRLTGSGKAEISAIYENTNINDLKNISEKVGIRLPDNPKILDPPTTEEIKVLREMDPHKVYLR